MFNGAWFKETGATSALQFSVRFSSNAFASIRGSGFYHNTSSNNTTFTNFYLNYDGTTDGATGSGFQTSTSGAIFYNARIHFSGFIVVTSAVTMYVRMRDVVSSTTGIGIHSGTGFTLIKVKDY